jgi:hypothetical protein
VQSQPEVHEQPLGVIARAIRLANRDAHVAGEAGEQQSALDLGTRHGRRVGERAEPAAADRERECVAALFLDFCPHGAERLRDPPHGPAAQRGIPGQGRLEALTREDAEHQPGRRAGIAAV